MKTNMVSIDGANWYECSNEQFQEYLADDTVDFWVDWSDDTRTWILMLSTIRAMRKQAEVQKVSSPWGKPATLYGIPVYYE